MEQMALDDILGGTEPPVAVPEPPPVAEPTEPPAVVPEAAPEKQPTAAEAKERQRGADGKFVAQLEAEKAAKEAAKEPVKQELTEKELGFLKTIETERRKRQELERENAALRAPRAPAAPAQPEVPAEPPKTFWDDPEGTLTRFEQKLQGAIVNTRLNTAEMLARSRHTDFDEKMDVFKELVKSTPGVWNQCVNSPDPAEFAYQTGKRHKELADVGGMEQWEAQKEKELTLKVETKLKEKLEKEAKERAAIPGSLSEVRGTTQHTPVWGGPTPLDNVLHDK